MAFTTSYIGRIKTLDKKLSLAWKKHDLLEEKKLTSQFYHTDLMYSLEYTKLNMTAAENLLMLTQDNINELSIAKEDFLNKVYQSVWGENQYGETWSYLDIYGTDEDLIRTFNNKLRVAWEKHDYFDEEKSIFEPYSEILLDKIKYTLVSISVIDLNIMMIQDKINELSIEKEDMIREQDRVYFYSEDLSDDLSDVYDQMDDFLDFGFEFMPRERKVRSNVMTERLATKSNKPIKNHKLPPRSVKNDRSKKLEAKIFSRKVRASHM
jgi:hypothetical protein